MIPFTNMQPALYMPLVWSVLSIQQTGLIEEINFFALGLQYVRTPQGLESAQFPGYYVQLDETLAELNHFPSVIVLKSRTGEKKVILPAVDLQTNKHRFFNRDCRQKRGLLKTMISAAIIFLMSIRSTAT